MTRRCGNRIKGGVYIEVPLSKSGSPIEAFICDPAIPVDEALEIPARGVVLRTLANGQRVLFDWIGMDNYPNVLDFIEEVRAQGLSRRIPETFDFSQLDETVRYAAVHSKGFVANEAWYRQYAQEHSLLGADGIKRETPWPCPKGTHFVDDNRELPCSAVWWHDLRPGYGEATDKERIRKVEQPSGPPYYAMERPKEIVPIYKDAMVLILPIVKLAVIRGGDGEHVKPLEKARKVGGDIRVEVEDA